MSIFSLAGYKLSGGAFNLNLIVGGIIFNRVITLNLVAMFIGSLLGCLTARMFYDQFLRMKVPDSTNKELKNSAISNKLS